MTICAIHQPNFFPWCGFFDKIKKADIFIFLDEVAYPKSGSGSGSWCNRVKLLNSGQPSWYGMPIQKVSGVQLINKVLFSNKEFQSSKFKKSLLHNYQKAPFYPEVMDQIQDLIDYPSPFLAEYNIHAITKIAHLLGLKTQFIRQSELSHTSHATELLIELIKQVGGSTYLCGGGTQGYQEDALFAEHGIQLRYQQYDPHQDVYKINQDTEVGLSILHFLFHQNLIN
jgi:hypothetical protein